MIETVSTENAPKALGPYSQALKAGGFVWCSGQIPIDPAVNAVTATIRNKRVVLVDDLLATGGTMAAACSLVERLGGVVAKILFVVELKGFDARNTTLAGRPVVTLLSYDGK